MAHASPLSVQRRRKLADELIRAEEAERRRVSRQLHDDAAQSLACVRLQLELLEMSLPKPSAETLTRLNEAKELTDRTILQVRQLIGELSPDLLDQLGLIRAVRRLVTRFRRTHSAVVRLSVDRVLNLPLFLEVMVYRVLQECLRNIEKHSSASTVNISLTVADGVLRLNVKDDGIGFDANTALAGLEASGLAGIRERVALLGGSIRITSTPARGRPVGGGTEISVELPVD